MSDDRTAAPPARDGSVAGDLTRLHRLLVESVRDYAIFALDRTGHVLSWSVGAEHLKGYTADDVIGRHFSIFYPSDKVESRFPDYELERAAIDGRFEDEGWRVRKDGSRFWANVVITALRDERGDLVGFAKVTRDLTERRAAEDALRRSEERFRLLVQGVRDYAIFLLDPAGRVQTWNEGAQRIKGYGEAEILGQHFSRFYPSEDAAAHKPQRELEIAVREGTYEEEGWRVRKDGSQFWANVVITALRDERGDLVGFSKVTRDLTERRAAHERALRDTARLAAEEASRRVAEDRVKDLHAMTDELHRQAGELEARSREAERANRVKSEFLAAMSHELRTPLNAIGGYAELLAMEVGGPVTPEQRQHIERIRRSQQHLLVIINDLLNFSRIEAGRLTYELEAVPVGDAARAVAELVAPQAQAKGLALQVEESGPGPVARADRAKTEQVLLNLLSNAVKFTGPGGAVTVACAAVGDTVAVSVRDTGIGIPPDQLEAVFEPFVQLGRTHGNHREGTGLGLAISRDLARGMGGTLAAESAVGKGSTFTLTLPAAER